MELNQYLFFRDDCEEAMTLYVDTLGGEIVHVMRNGDAPSEEERMPGGDNLVMNMVAKVAGRLVMASDNSPDMYQTPQGFRLQIEVDSDAEFDRVYAALAKDARAHDMPAGETFWAVKFAMFTDRFGTPWMLNYTGDKMG
ncbi:VOC family protein [Roseobacter sp. HKCCA0434]|uniref:VOC family protein n=1 Tax=Roseobacter sp. HKCCA0434 TaxID=3079297 RepID=UPI002905ADC5|nr:VOC family protein [Roseobacter sp. HKCCA0434]